MNKLDHRTGAREHHDVMAVEIAQRRGELDGIHLRAADFELMGENENLHGESGGV
jgi:hypothetical protein